MPRASPGLFRETTRWLERLNDPEREDRRGGNLAISMTSTTRSLGGLPRDKSAFSRALNRKL
jgi:hypothetical protein